VRPASSALVALLQSDQFIMADLYTFTLVGGGVFLYSAAATAVTDSTTGRMFQLGPRFERSRVKTVVGVQVDELDINVYPDTTDLLGTTPFLAAAWQGQFDGALVQLERAFMPAWGNTTPGTIVLFAGKVSDLDCSRTGIDMKCRSHLELLNIQMPRRLWQGSCGWVFGAPGCNYDRVGGHNALGTATGAGAATLTAITGSTSDMIIGAPTPSPPTLWNQGSIVGLSGANQGFTRTISGVTGDTVNLKLPFLSPVAAGDQFQLLPGCDHTLPTCANVFQNQARFGGFPYIPTPETAV
jgi:uncharacterized phage protein (TIGR02218 family)